MDLFVWFFHPQYQLHYHYDERSDQIVYENGTVSTRPPNFSSEYLLTVKRSVLASDPHIPRTVLQYPSGYHAEPEVASPPSSPSYVHSTGRTPQSNVTLSMPPNPSVPTSGHVARGLEQPSNETLARISPTALATYTDSMSLKDPPARRLSYHAPVTRMPQSPQANRVQVYTTPAGMLRSTPQTSEPIPEGEAKLYSSFKRKIKTKKFFVVGKVFLTLWTEPAGDVGSNYTAITSGFSVGPFGEILHSKIRRFVVVRAGEQSCTAVPVLTYGHQGVGKQGVKKSEHAIIYTGKEAPEPRRAERAQRGEEGMLVAIRVDADDASEKLDPLSRIHFGKVYSIEHNVKVRSFGKVNAASMTSLLYQFRAVWERSSSGRGSQLQIQTPQGVRTETIEETDSADQADLMRAYNTLLANGHTTEEIKKVLRVGFQLPSAGEPSHQPSTEVNDASSEEEEDDTEIVDEET